MDYKTCNLNIRWDMPASIWNKVELIGKKMEGWIGHNDEGLPCWFGFEDDEKWIVASVETSGYQFTAQMDDQEWQQWINKFKQLTTEKLGFKVGELELGEVSEEIEWL